MHSILIVDDEPDICELLEDILLDEGYRVESAGNGQEAKEKFYNNDYSLILMDIWMPDIDGISLLTEFVKAEKKTPAIIMMSGHGTVETAVEATRLGAYDFLEKPLSTAKLLLTVQNALSHAELAAENVRLKTDKTAGRTTIAGKSQYIQDLKQSALNAAKYSSPVLISGETGGGKSLLARFIHTNSANSAGPFVQVVAASVLSSNMEHELFGTESASGVHPGKLEQAEGGTLFIKQIENIELATQAILAGALRSGEFRRIGGLAGIKLSFRIIVSTAADLENEVREGNFSEDLYYFLNVLNIKVAPLLEHKEDINELVEFFVHEFTEADGLPYRKFSLAAKNFMLQHDWFGNVIELENLVQRLLINDGSEEISLDELKENLAPPGRVSTGVISDEALYSMSLKAARDAFERGYLLHHLRETGGNISKTSQNIGVERANLYRKLRVHKIDPKKL